MITRDSAKSFIWDHGNTDKNWRKHRVTTTEAEDPFFDSARKEFGDSTHSSLETRHIVIGSTNTNRLLYVAYTLRKNKIRIISARDVNKKERSLYEKTS
jgi:uncharacterized DUF497 family protein